MMKSTLPKYFFAGVFLAVLSLPKSSANPASDLVGYWKFDNGPHSSVGGWIGAPRGDARIEQYNALLGTGCYHLDQGSGYLSTSMTGPSGSRPRSVSVWFQTAGNTGYFDALFGWGGSQDRRRYDFRLGGGDLRIEMGGGIGYSFRLAKKINDQRWHHALISFRGSDFRYHTLYVDGKRAGTSSSLQYPVNTPTTYKVRIGTGVQRHTGSDKTARDFNGRIDDFGIFNRALSAADAALIHGLGRFGVDLSALQDARDLWAGPDGGTADIDGMTWRKTSGLQGRLGDYGGSIATEDAYIVLGGSGSGIQISNANYAPLSDYDIIPLEDPRFSLGFGLSHFFDMEFYNVNSTLSARWELRTEGDVPVDWFQPSETSGLLEPGDSIIIRCTMDSAGLAPGTYFTRFAVVPHDMETGEIPETAWQTVEIVVGEPAFKTDPPGEVALSCLVGFDPPPATLRVLSTADDSPVTDIQVQTSEPWLHASVSNDGSGTLTLSADAAAMSPGNHTATVSISNDETKITVPVTLNIAALHIVKLAADPRRPRIYGIHRIDDETPGALVVIDTLTRKIVKFIPLGKKPSDLDFTEDADALLVINNIEPNVQKIDLDTLETTETWPVTFSKWNESPDLGGHVEDGPGSVIYYVDEQWGPRLRVFDTATREVLQTLGAESGESPNLNNDHGYGDIEVSPDGKHLFAWMQHGNTAGVIGTQVIRFDIQADGTLANYAASRLYDLPGFSRDPRNTPVLITADGARLVIKNRTVDQTDLDKFLAEYPHPIYATSPGGAFVCTTRGIYPGEGGGKIAPLPIQSAVQAITPDCSWLLTIDENDGSRHWMDLRTNPGLPALGIADSPPDGATVFQPARLSWIPEPMAYRYQVYLGTDEAAVRAATPDSPTYLGETPAPHMALSTPPTPETQYFWKVVTFKTDGSQSEAVRSFLVSPLIVDTAPVSVETIKGVVAYHRHVSLGDSGTPVSWTAQSDMPWVVLENNSGTTPADLDIKIKSAGLTTGKHTATVTIRSGGATASIRIFVTMLESEIRQLVSDPVRPVVYALAHVEPGTGQSQVVFINAETQKLETGVPAGSDAYFLAYHPGDDRIYVTRKGSRIVPVIDAATRAPLPALTLPETIEIPQYGHTLTPLDAGRIAVHVTNEYAFVSTADGSLAAGPYHNASGHSTAYDPQRKILYIGQTGTTGDPLRALDITTDPPEILHSITGYFGGFVVRLSADGSRIFWKNWMLDTNLEVVSQFEQDIFETDPDGKIAIGAESIWWSESMVKAAKLPYPADFFMTAIVCLNPASGKLITKQWNNTLRFANLADLVDLPGPAPQPGMLLEKSPETLSWTPTPGATGYKIYLSKSKDDLGSPDSLAATVSEPTWSPDSTLDFGTVYYWQIEPMPAGVAPRSDTYSFTIRYPEHQLTGTPFQSYALSIGFGDDMIAIGGLHEVGFYRFDRKTGASSHITNKDAERHTNQPGNPVAVGQFDVLARGANFETARFFPIDSHGTILPAKTISSPDPGSRNFGASLARDGGIAMIAALGDYQHPGAVFVYQRWPSWHLVQTLTPSEPFNGDLFGKQIRIDGNHAIITAQDKYSDYKAFVFERDPADGLWKETALIRKPTNPRVGDFAKSVAISGDRVAITADRGVLVYEKSADGEWKQAAFIESPQASAVSLDGDDLVVSNVYATPPLGGAGKVYPFHYSEGQWQRRAPLWPGSTTPESPFRAFGSFLQLRDGWLAAGQQGRVHGESTYAWVFQMAPEPNARPAFSKPMLVQAAEGKALSFPLGLTDLEDDPVSVSILQGPEWLSVSEDADLGHVLAGTPPLGGTGDFTAQLSASDGNHASLMVFDIEVIPADDVPRITLHPTPESLDLGVGQQLVLRGGAEGSGPFAWQWQRNGIDIPGATEPRLVVPKVSLDDAGAYTFTVANAAGSVASDPAAVTVHPPNRFAGPWPTFGNGPDHTGFQPAALGRHKFVRAWKRKFSLENTPIQPVATDGKQVFVGTRTGSSNTPVFYSLDLATGETRWTYHVPANDSINPPTWHDGRVYFQLGQYDKPSLVCLDSKDGNLVWTAPFAAQRDHYKAPAVTFDGAWINGGRYGGMYGYDPDGNPMFFVKLEQYDNWTPTVSDGRLFTWIDGKFREHKLFYGDEIWKLDIDLWTTGNLVAASGDSAVVRTVHDVVCIDLTDRAVRWRAEAKPRGTPAIAGGTVFVISERKVLSWNLEDGTPGLAFPTPQAILSEQPVVLRNHLIVASKDHVFIFDRHSAELVETLDAGGQLAYSNGYILVADTKGALSAYFANAAPEFDETMPVNINAGDAAGDMTIPLGEHASDPDPGDPLAWAIVSVSNNEIFRTLEINADTGDLTVIYNPWQSGTSDVTVSMTDSAGNTTEHTITFFVPPHPAPQIDVADSLVLNRQTGLYEHTITVANTGAREIAGFDLSITGLPEGVCVWNASDCTKGPTTIQHRQVLAAGASATIILEYYAKVRGTKISPTVTAALVTEPETDPPAPDGGLSIDRALRLADGSMLVEFTAVPGALYEVHYSTDGEHWKLSPVRIRAAGNRVQWIDRGPPRTDTPPSQAPARFYRVRQVSGD